MKYPVILFLILLSSCSREIPPGSQISPGSRAGKNAAAILESSTQYDERDIHSAAASMISAGLALGSASAERCWQTETKRRNIALECALAWSIGRERSVVLEQGLAQLAPVNRTAALAAVRAEFPLERVGLGDLPALLLQLNGDPVWVRARAVKIWLRTHPVPPVREADDISKLILSGKLLIPADFRESYELFSDLKPALSAAMLGEHCGPLIGEDLQVRCWRFLSAFLGKNPGRRLPPELEARIPPRGRAWQLFRIGMPARARLFAN